jgi:plastocyanin
MRTCLREEGSATRAQFGAFLISPLVNGGGTVVGHPSWRIAPGYLTAEVGEKLRVRNTGGRGHTFTEVAQYGGGFVGALNIGLTQAPECAAAASTVIAPGARMEVTGLALGDHKFQCCIHPWMRADIKVVAEN